MKNKRSVSRTITLAGMPLLFIANVAVSATVVTLDDITFWTGTGENRAAMVVDWDETSSVDQSLVWGYRWDGSAFGAEMFEAIVTADSRLYAKLNQPVESSTGTLLYGFGYDLNGDATFDISDGTTFDAYGIAISGPPDLPPIPAATSSNPADHYAEGWYTGFWHYGISSESASPFEGGEWIATLDGMTSRKLSDGDWDSWTFTSNTQPPFIAFAENPYTAEAPLAADFDTDNDVDGMDFIIWQRGFGITSGAKLAQGDANGDGMVNGLDLNLWQENVGSRASMTVIPQTVPEPSSAQLTIYLLLFIYLCSSRKETSHEVATMVRFYRTHNKCNASFNGSRDCPVCDRSNIVRTGSSPRPWLF
jgi:hypothetical protein